MKLSVEYFDSQALIKQREILNSPPHPLSRQNLPSNAPLECNFFTEGCFVWSTIVVEYGKVTC